MNRVEYYKEQIIELENRIEEIQNSCEHELVFLDGREPWLVETLVPGVYLGRVEGDWPKSITCPEDDTQNHFLYSLKCNKCEYSFSASIWYICPKCFSKMEKSDKIIDSRKKYFGENYLYYGPRIYFCPKLHFRVVCDEWNQ